MSITDIFSETSTSLAVVCHDAGATNLILAWLGTQANKNRRVVMQGPAKKLWDTAHPAEATVDSFYEAMMGSDILLSGTGWASDLEHDARKFARDNSIYSIAVIDHWVNYQERFVRNNQIIMPDEFWVTDEYALLEAKKCFPKKNIKLKPNLYIQEQLKLIRPIEKLQSYEILYVLEPARNDWGRSIQGEFQALDFFIEKLPTLNLPSEIIIRLRPHPSDPVGKYDNWIEQQEGLKIYMDDTSNIAESISCARWVAGCESFALVLSLESGRKVFSTLPPWAPDCRLPQKGLAHLKKLCDI